MAKDGAEVFKFAVDEEDYPQYYELIEMPMDFGSIRQKLGGAMSSSVEALQRDVNLIFHNCRQFNAAESEICKVAERLAKVKDPLHLRTFLFHQ